MALDLGFLKDLGKGAVDIILSTTEGDVCITANQNGKIRIKGSNIELVSDVDIDFRANRNINLNAGARILLNGNKVDRVTVRKVEHPGEYH